MTVTTIPQREGELAPVEAEAWVDAQQDEPNLASNQDLAARALKYVDSTISEWTDRMRGLHRRWRATYYMLAGNTLDKAGMEDVHVPEIWKAIETLVPRIEEAILEKDPWFRIVPRRLSMRDTAETTAAYIDWQFDQAKIRDQVQAAIRDMLVTQCASWYGRWEVRKKVGREREIVREFDAKGRLRRSVKSGPRKEMVDYLGPLATLIDPFDFIIDTKSTSPQNAIYVGHRVFMTVDEIRRVGRQMGWLNLDNIETKVGQNTSFGVEQNYYKWSRDPTARYSDPDDRIQKQDGRPEKLEVVVLYSRWSLTDDHNYDDYRMVAVGGRTVLELRRNPYDGQIRPYATARSTKSGHEFYGTGTFDNAIRLNQHLDRYHQTFLRGAMTSAVPFAFIEDDDGEFPDSLYKITPGKVFPGVSGVRFSQVPDGFLRSAPLVLGTLQRNIEETVGAFRIQMGQDLSGGTATEATLSLQEGNRRTRGIIRAMGDGLGQLLELFYKFNQQFSMEDVEFPVLGKRGLDLRKTHANIGPADLLDDVKFDLVGLHSLRTYGLKATGLQAFVTSMMPLIVANPQSVDQIGLMHEFASELIGPDEADMLVRVPTSPDKLRSQELENEILVSGEEAEVDPDDVDEDHLEKMQFLFDRAKNPDDPMHADVKRVVIQHYTQHLGQAQRKEAQKKAMEARQPPQQMLPPEAGGQQGETGASPQAGGMSAAMQLASEPGGQTPGENPGPADVRKYPRSGKASRTTNQTENAL